MCFEWPPNIQLKTMSSWKGESACGLWTAALPGEGTGRTKASRYRTTQSGVNRPREGRPFPRGHHHSSVGRCGHLNLGEPDSRVTIKHPPPTHSSALQVKPQQEKSLLTQKQSEPCWPPGPLSSCMKGFGNDAPSTGGVASLVCQKADPRFPSSPRRHILGGHFSSCFIWQLSTISFPSSESVWKSLICGFLSLLQFLPRLPLLFILFLNFLFLNFNILILESQRTREANSACSVLLN